MNGVDEANLVVGMDTHLDTPGSGAAHCSVSDIQIPPGGGSPEGLHTHAVDQLSYILAGSILRRSATPAATRTYLRELTVSTVLASA